MRKLGLVLFVSITFLTACGDDKTEGTSTTNTAELTKKPSTEAKPATVAEEVVVGDSGEAIHQANCLRCHTNSVYTRKDRKVSSLDGLVKQVQMCDTQLETQLFPEDLDKVVTYLNESFYKF